MKLKWAMVIVAVCVIVTVAAVAYGAGQRSAASQSVMASQPVKVSHTAKEDSPRSGSGLETRRLGLDIILQALTVVVLGLALYVYWRQAVYTSDAVRAAVSQAVTDRMVNICHFLAQNQKLLETAFPRRGDHRPTDMAAAMAVHPFLLHFENVMTVGRRHLPKKQLPCYMASMPMILSHSPLMVQWFRYTDAAWSSELRDIVEQVEHEQAAPMECAETTAAPSGGNDDSAQPQP